MQTTPGPKHERGAIIIHVALALLMLIAFSAFVVDMGVMWVSRGQAQNASDAGALAGAVGLMRDGGSSTEAALSAMQWASNNAIFGATNSSTNVRITFSGASGSCGPSCDISPIPPCGATPGCVRVDVFRNAPDRPYRSGNVLGAPIQTLFGPLIGVTQQRVRATATAEVASGNMVRCMIPWALADRWADHHDEQVDTTWFANDGLSGTAGWSPNDLFEDAIGGYTTPHDTYTPPYRPGHTGWTVAGDYGRQLVLKNGSVGQFSAGWANTVNLPGSVGGNDTLWDIRGCNPTPVGIAEETEDCSGYPSSGTTVEQAAAGCLGVQTGVGQGYTRHGAEDGGPAGPPDPIVQQDPGARWSRTAVGGPNGETGAVVTATGALNMSSPRVRPAAVFDINSYMTNASCRNQSGTGCVVRVVNIIGFFIEGMCDTVRSAGQLDPGVSCDPSPSEARRQVVGRIVTLPSTYYAGAGEIEEDASFLQVVRLVR